jgi:uncharacterized membrane protein (Fun14 family)
MITSKTKTTLLIIGVIIACLLILQSLGIHIDDTGRLQNGSINLEISTASVKDIFLVKNGMIQSYIK